MIPNATVKAGVYCRLSVDDQSAGESGSIQTQKALLADYCKQHGLRIIDYFIDDGVSGTSFERPGFQRMLEAIEAGEINTVICKDLSRFGRNYCDAGIYIDRYFVQRDIRFITPGDNLDTNKGKSDLNVAIINMMNDFYARGISDKTKAAKQIRAKQGMFVGSKPPYGYAGVIIGIKPAKLDKHWTSTTFISTLQPISQTIFGEEVLNLSISTKEKCCS